MRPDPAQSFPLLSPKLSMDLHENTLASLSVLLGAFIYSGGERHNTKTGTKEKWHLRCEI